MDDLATLVIAAQQGDKAAFNQVVLRFQDMAYATAYAMTHDAGLAQDVAQEAFIDAYLSLPNLREPAAFPGWFRRIIVKQADRQTRRRQVETVSLEHLTDLRSPAPTPDRALELALDQEDVDAVIKALPPAQRLVILLFYIEGYSQQEIADYLEAPLTAVKKRLFNARQTLKERMISMVQTMVQSNRPSADQEFANKIAFFLAVRANDLPQVKRLLQQDPALVQAVTEFGSPAQGYYGGVGFTALHWGAGMGNRALIELLFAHGANINQPTARENRTPLHEAVHMLQSATVEFLLARGADPNLTAFSGQTPLHLAVHRNSLLLVQKLVAAGAELERKDDFGHTPLAWALLYGRSALAELLTTHTLRQSASVPTSTTPITDAQEVRRVPVGPQLLGRALDHAGRPLDNGDALADTPHLPIYRPATAVAPPILATGIKIVDLFAPLKRGGHNALFSPLSGVGRMVTLGQLAYSMHTLHNGYTVCLGLARRGYTAQDMQLYWRNHAVEPALMSERIVTVFAHSQDAATQKLQAAETGLTIAEALRAQGHEVLLLVDADLAMAEGVAAYLRANTAATPTAAITTLYWGDYTVGYEPPPLAGLDTALAMDRWRADRFLHPAIDPLRSRSALLESSVLGTDHCQLVAELKRHFVRYSELDRMIETFGEDALSILNDPHALQDARRIRRIHRFLTQSLPGLEFFNGLPGLHVNVADTIAGCRAILAGETDALPEEAFFMVGTLAQVKAKAQTL